MLLAFSVSLLAGLATALGGLLVLSPHARDPRVLGAALALAGGAMLAVSALEILPRSTADLTAALGAPAGWASVLAAVAAGVGLVLLVDRTAARHGRPLAAGPSSLPIDGAAAPAVPDAAGGVTAGEQRARLQRTGVVVATAVALHNLPEGMSTFLATLADPSTGIAFAVAVAIHNVPEGVAVAAPILAATGRRTRALGWAAASGAAEPVGALVGVLLVGVLLPAAALPVLFAVVGGMMAAISLRELLPAAVRALGLGPLLVSATTAGAGVMALSLALLR